MRDWIRYTLIILILSGIGIGIGLGIYALVVNWDDIQAEAYRLDHTEDYRADIINKEEEHYTTIIFIPVDKGLIPIVIWHHYYYLYLNNTKCLSVGSSFYGSVDIGDTVVVYLSGRVEKLNG